jgi:hypothetical protein
MLLVRPGIMRHTGVAAAPEASASIGVAIDRVRASGLARASRLGGGEGGATAVAAAEPVAEHPPAPQPAPQPTPQPAPQPVEQPVATGDGAVFIPPLFVFVWRITSEIYWVHENDCTSLGDSRRRGLGRGGCRSSACCSEHARSFARGHS